MARTLPPNAGGHETYESTKQSTPTMAQFVIGKPRVTVMDYTKNSFEYINGCGSGTIGVNGAGSGDLTQVGTSKISGLALTTTKDNFGVLVDIPHDADMSKELRFRILHTGTNALSAGTVAYSGFYTIMDTSGTSALTWSAGSAATGTAFDTNFAEQDCKAKDNLQWTDWAVIDAGTFTNLTAVPGDDQLLLMFMVTLATVTESVVLKVQMEYSRMYIG